MNKQALSLMTFLIFLACGHAQAKNVTSSVCPNNASDVLVIADIYHLGFVDSIMITLLSGNTKTAIHSLGGEMATEVLMLGSIVKTNECGMSRATINMIYPSLRLVAAINHIYPIPEINQNKAVMKILQEAISNNPAHYEALLKRAKHWGRGIN